mmetsp:Transcript_75090/g.87186  ORF Transcript_75090/g.87186 Transcript_75090/m.87186 type:complete len:112 (-) Transcript_75090:6-341(-)
MVPIVVFANNKTRHGLIEPLLANQVVDCDYVDALGIPDSEPVAMMAFARDMSIKTTSRVTTFDGSGCFRLTTSRQDSPFFVSNQVGRVFSCGHYSKPPGWGGMSHLITCVD